MVVDVKKAFLKGTLSLSLSVIIIKILGVLFKVPLSYILGDDGMGYFNSAYAIYGFFYILCTSGVPKSITLVISQYRAEFKGRSHDKQILMNGLKLFSLIGMFSTLLIIIMGPFIVEAIGNKNALYSLIAVAPSIWFVSVSSVLRGYFNSVESLGTIAVSQMVEAVIKLVIGLGLAWIGTAKMMSAPVISALALLGISVGSLVSFVYLIIGYKKQNTDNNSRQNVDIKPALITAAIAKNAFPIALSSSLLNLSATLDLSMIIKRLAMSGVSVDSANSLYGNYTTLAVPMFSLVISVLTPVAVAYMPRLAELNLNKEGLRFSESLNSLIALTLFISIPAAFSFIFYGFDILDILFSVQSSAIGADMLTCLAVGLPVFMALTVVNTALESSGRIFETVISLLVGCVTKYIVSYELIGMPRMGILGAPIGTVASYAVSLCVSLIALKRARIQVKIIRKMLMLALVALISFLGPYYLIYRTSLAGETLLSMLTSLMLSFVGYVLIVALLSFPSLKYVLKMHKR